MTSPTPYISSPTLYVSRFVSSIMMVIGDEKEGSWDKTEFHDVFLNYFCTNNMISRQYSAPKTRQQNVLLKMNNKIYNEVVRTMLSQSKHPVHFFSNWKKSNYSVIF